MIAFNESARARTPRLSGSIARASTIKGSFDAATAAASTEARRRLQHRGAALGEELSAQVERLHADLERWRDAERVEIHRRFEQSGAEGPAQLGLFADDPAVGRLTTLDEALAVIDTAFAERAGQLARAHRVGEVAGPDPVGCLLIVPQVVLGGGR